MEMLRFDGSNDFVNLASACSVNWGAATWEVAFGATIRRYPVSGNEGILGADAGTTTGITLRQASGDGAAALLTSGTFRVASAAGYLELDVYHDYRIYRDSGGTIHWERDGSDFSTSSFSTSTTQTVRCFGRANTGGGFALMDLSYLELVGFTNAQEWRADLTDGTGDTLPTVSGSNQGTLTNFPTNDSQWIGFEEAVTAVISAGLPVPTADASSTVSAPIFSSAISAGLPIPTVAANSTVTAPVFTAVISSGLPVPAASASASSSVPVYTATISAGLPIPAASVVAVNAGTNNTAEISAGLPVPTASASVSVSAPVFTANISAGLPVPTASVLASPNVVNSAVIAAGLPAPTASVSAVSVLPVYQAAISAGLPVPNASVIAISGQRQVTILPEAQASVAFESTIVAVDFQSRSAALSNQSRLVAL